MWLLVVGNGLGTIYGYYWYKNQILATPPQWLVFVPDSPTASGFFTLAIALYLLGRANPWVEAFASLTSVKYGIWAVAMIVWTAAWRVEMTGVEWGLQAFHPLELMLMASHLGMAIEAVLYYRLFRVNWTHLIGVLVWLLINDGVDYIADMHPWVSDWIHRFPAQMAVVTVALSLLSFALFAFLQKLQLQKS